MQHILDMIKSIKKATPPGERPFWGWFDLSRAELFEVDLSGADLRSANLSWADLRSANLSGADLSGADLDYSVWPLARKSHRAKDLGISAE
jgi:hypothetical protein